MILRKKYNFKFGRTAALTLTSTFHNIIPCKMTQNWYLHNFECINDNELSFKQSLHIKKENVFLN